MVLKNVQGLRGIAALMVCFFHLNYLMKSDVLHFFSASGYLGVDIFFVISGIIMVLTTKKLEGASLYKIKTFLTKRAIRIIPLYYITTIIWIAVTHRVDFYFRSHALELIEAFCFMPFPAFTHSSPYPYPALYVCWSLNYEILFYAIFAIGFLFKRWQYYFIYLVLGSLVLLIPLFEGWVVSRLPSYGFIKPVLGFLKNPIQLFFLAGVVIGNFLPLIRLTQTQTQLLAAAFAGFFLSYYFHMVPDNFVIRLTASTLLVGAFVLCDQHPSTIQTPRFLLYTGDISYSIYLIHPILIAYLPGFITKAGIIIPVWSVYFFVVFFAVLLVASTLSYEIIEKMLTHILGGRKIQSSPLLSVFGKASRSLLAVFKR